MRFRAACDEKRDPDEPDPVFSWFADVRQRPSPASSRKTALS